MVYTDEELVLKLAYYEALPEKARRHFLALQYAALGRGSQRYLASVFKCSRATITKGTRELEQTPAEALDYTRQRKAGGGRKKKKN